MNGKYTLKDGSRISVYLWPDFLEGDDWRGSAEVHRLDKDGHYSGEMVYSTLHKDDNGLFINWNGENVYMNEFYHIPYSELVTKLNECVEKKDRWLVDDDDILATFMKETDKVGIVGEFSVFDTLIPCMGIGMTSDKTATVMMVPVEKRHKKSEWRYKVDLEVANKELLCLIASESVYWDDFCSFLKSGIYRLVDKDKYMAKNAEKEIKGLKKPLVFG